MLKQEGKMKGRNWKGSCVTRQDIMEAGRSGPLHCVRARVGAERVAVMKDVTPLPGLLMLSMSSPEPP